MSLKTATILSGLLVLLFMMTGCLYPAHLDPASTKYAQISVAPPDPNYAVAIQTNYQHAMKYAVDVQQSYRCFLVNNAEASEGFGLLMIAAGPLTDTDSMTSEKSFGLFTPVEATRYALLTEATEKSTPVFGAQ